MNRIIDGGGDYSLSVFICPKSLWESNFLNDDLRKELPKSSADYVVFPTNLYARYLLANAYKSLGEMEQCERNMKEFPNSSTSILVGGSICTDVEYRV